MKVTLVGREIPRNKQGDPNFVELGHQSPGDMKGSLLHIFTPDEIVELVNRAIYQLEYQRESHKRRSQEERDTLAPVKAALKVVHPHVSFAKATEQQIEDALQHVKKNAEAK